MPFVSGTWTDYIQIPLIWQNTIVGFSCNWDLFCHLNGKTLEFIQYVFTKYNKEGFF